MAEFMTFVWKGKTYEVSHGEPFDRGMSDSYYRRRGEVHWWPQGTGNGDKITIEGMTEKQIAEYNAGYEYNEDQGDFKDWG